MAYFIKEKILKFINNIIKAGVNKNKYPANLFVKELKEGDSLFLRVPDNIPREILNDFSLLFEKYKDILLAYLAKGFLAAGESPHYIVGIKIDPNSNFEIEQLMELIAKNLHEIIPKGFYVDFIAIDDRDTPINNFMRDYLIPFYSR